MLNKEEKICACCGCVITDDDYCFEYDGDFYCEDCTYENFVECYDCGEMVPVDDVEYIDGEYYCDHCIGRNFTTCYDCGEYVRLEDAWYSDSTHEHYCEHCFFDSHVYCECCDSYVLNDDYDFDAECCLDCSGSRLIGSYHSHSFDFIGTSGADNYYKGIELEIEQSRYTCDNDALAVELDRTINANNYHIYFEHDGSLDSGFEIITNPHTFAEFYAMDWEKLLSTCVDYGFISHNANSCGLHIHYSREWFGDTFDAQVENIGKLIAFYERHIDDLVNASRRTHDNYVRWADNYHTNGDVEECKECAKGCNTRYKYINLTNMDTIEFRLGRGTLNYKSFMAWNNLHDTLIKNVKNVSYTDIDNLNVWFDGIAEDTVTYLHNKNAFVKFESEVE